MYTLKLQSGQYYTGQRQPTTADYRTAKQWSAPPTTLARVLRAVIVRVQDSGQQRK